MTNTLLTALSPLDGRYASKVKALQPIMSEQGLIYYRLSVEVQWLITLTEQRKIKEAESLSKSDLQALQNILTKFSETDAEAIKTIEQTTNHDVKAVEYFIQEKLKSLQLEKLIPFVHFGCTSEDINNLAYALMLKEARSKVMQPAMQCVIDFLHANKSMYANTAMLSRTHGQPATPTTLGKELANFAARLQHQLDTFLQIPIFGKFNGAVGNFNAHHAAYPNLDWPAISEQFVESLGLTYNPLTTQIEPHDGLAQLLQCLMRFNNILIDMDRDTWGYISLGYFKQKKIAGEVGSSTMPHKINPIDFENSEGNLGIANALADHLANKLPISRWQRDLSDSTVLRNLGPVFGYSLLSYQATKKGLDKLDVNLEKIHADLEHHWEVLAEPIQTVMRRYGIADAYEQLKAFSRGEALDQQKIKAFVQQLQIPDDAKQSLLELTPAKYLGFAPQLANL